MDVMIALPAPHVVPCASFVTHRRNADDACVVHIMLRTVQRMQNSIDGNFIRHLTFHMLPEIIADRFAGIPCYKRREEPSD